MIHSVAGNLSNSTCCIQGGALIWQLASLFAWAICVPLRHCMVRGESPLLVMTRKCIT